MANLDFPTGLSSAEVQKQIQSGNTNKVDKKTTKSYTSIICGNIFTFFNLLGLIVTVALIICHAPTNRFFFCVVYILNILIGIIQEIRSKRCVDSLSLMATTTVNVIRNGEINEISPNDIVLGDLVSLGIGEQIPVDGELVSGEVEVNESLLTGESIPIKKNKGDSVLAGSFIVSGKCVINATAVGKAKYVESITAIAKKYKKPKSEIMLSLRRIITVIGCLIIPLASILLIKASVIGNTEWVDSIDSTAAAVIGMIPSGMFLLTTLALAVGIIKLFRHDTLVQDLYSLEMLARVDTICFDKTGTITNGNLKVNAVIPVRQRKVKTITNIISNMNGALRENNQTAKALVDYFGMSLKLDVNRTIPFSSARKFSAVNFVGKGTFILGAPEFILSKDSLAEYSEKISEYTERGDRVLILCHSDDAIIEEQMPQNVEPYAILALTDELRENITKTIEWFNANGVDMKVISGDNPVTVSNIAQQVGIPNAEQYINMSEVPNSQIPTIVEHYTVFGRVTPEQKALIVKALKADGHCVAMTGDGVNDIPALKESDCAVTVAEGSSATKSISHLILMNNDFNSMPKVVEEGRRVINNVQQSSSLYLMKTAFTMLFALLTIFGIFSTYPFTLPNMILLEFLVIGVPSFFLALQPNKERIRGKFIKTILQESIPAAISMVLSALFVYLAIIIKIIPNSDYATLGTLAFTLTGLINFIYISTPINKYRLSLIILDSLAVVGIMAIFFAIGNTPIIGNISIGEIFELQPVTDISEFLVLAAITILSGINIIIFNKIVNRK